MRIFFIFLLVAHSVLSFFFLKDTGFFSALPPFHEPYTSQIFSDLSVSLCLVLFFIFRESEKKKKPKKYFLLCAAGTLVLGSISPLLYLSLDKDLWS